MKKKYKNILYCTNDSGKNSCNRRDYFIENSENLITFHYILGFSDKFSYMEQFENGKMVLRKEFSVYRGKNVAIKNIFYYLYYVYILFFHMKRRTFILTTFPMYCVFNSFFKLFKKSEIVFWIEDYFPPKNMSLKLYNFLVNYYEKRLRYVIYISPRIAKIYSSSKKLGHNKYRSVVTLAIKRNSVKNKLSTGEIKLGFIGILREQQGLDLIFKYLQKYDETSLRVIGEGYGLGYYKKMAKDMDISEKVTFYGRVENLSTLFDNTDIGMALYENVPGNLSIYCEPSKIKTYLSFGLPVITTKTTYFAEELQKAKAGAVVEETTNSLHKAIKLVKTNYMEYLKGVKKLQEKYTYEKWYEKQFSFLVSN